MPMTEHIYLLEEADPSVFFGTNSSNLDLLKQLYPKLRIVARGTVIKVMGAEEETQEILKVLHRLEKYAARFNSLPESAVVEMVKGESPGRRSADGVILYGAYGQSITPRSENQKQMIQAIETSDLVFATGPAGTGKTFLAIAMAVKYLREKRARRIILSRPAVEAGERLGFLPGEMKDKLDPYLQPLYDALMELVPPTRLRDYMDTEVIQIAPLAYMRGRTLSDAVIVLDEAQNTTTHQMRMFLTRLGSNAKMIVTGDMSQVDLPRGVTSGLREATTLLHSVEGIGWITFERRDIMRHGLVKKIVAMYEQQDKRQERKHEETSDTASDETGESQSPDDGVIIGTSVSPAAPSGADPQMPLLDPETKVSFAESDDTPLTGGDAK